MILGSADPRAIGERRTGVYDAHGIYHARQAFVIVREATREEWLAWNYEQGVEDPRHGVHPGRHYFYEVATD